MPDALPQTVDYQTWWAALAEMRERVGRRARPTPLAGLTRHRPNLWTPGRSGTSLIARMLHKPKAAKEEEHRIIFDTNRLSTAGKSGDF